jgi:hypothetical protein
VSNVDVEAAIEAVREFLDTEGFLKYAVDKRAAETIYRYWTAWNVAQAKGVPDDVIQRACQLIVSHPGERPTNRIRNGWITEAIRRTVDRGFAPTRNVATRRQASACSVVAAALNQLGVDLEERGVEDIWRMSGKK